MARRLPGGLLMGHDSLEDAGLAGRPLGIEVRAETLVAEVPLRWFEGLRKPVSRTHVRTPNRGRMSS
jgi:hypothetical protein